MRQSILGKMVFVSLVMLGSSLGSASSQLAAGADHIWKSYINVRFHYAICYPEDLLIPQGEPPNSDGQKFLAKDGAQLIVFGRNNALGESVKDVLAVTASRLTGASGKVTHQVLKPNWFVVSGQNGHTVFYARTRYDHDQFKSFELTYDRSAAAVYEPLIGRLTSCFADIAG
jgi:hypothetical protein